MPGNSVGQIGLDLVANTQGFQRQMSGITGMAKSAGKALAGAFAVKKLVDFGKECLDLGSDLAEVQNVVDVTFPAMSEKVDSFAKSAASSFGLSETMAKQYVGTFGSMAKAFGFTEQQAYGMGAALTGLSGDVASFYNLSQDEAYTKLKSVFTGETESLKDLGVVMTQTALDSYALANGFGKTTDKMSEAEKVALRYQFVSEQLSAAQGDFARTSGGWANQVKILFLQFDSLKASIGQGLINIFTPVLKLVNTLVGKLSVLAGAFKSFTELLTGNKASGGVGTVASDADAASKGLGDAADSAGNLADNTGDVGTAAKKASKEMKNLMGFDKINRLEDDKSGSDDLADANLKGMDFGGLAQGETFLDGMDAKLGGVLDRFKELAGLFEKGFALGFGDTDFEGLIKECQRVGKALKDIFTDPKITAAAKKLTNRLAKTLGVATGSIARIAVKWGEAIIAGIADSLEKNKKWLSNAVSGLFDSWGNVLEYVQQIFQGISDILTSSDVLGGVRGLSESITTEFLKSAYASLSIGTTIATNLLGGISAYIDQNKEYIKEKLAGIFNVSAEILDLVGDVKLAFADILSVFAGEEAQQLTADIIGIFADGFLGVTELALKFARDIISTITGPFTDNADGIKEALQNTLGPISELAATLHDSIKKTFTRIGKMYDAYIKPMFDSFRDGLGEVVKTLLDGYNEYIAPVLDNLSQKFTEVWQMHVQPCLDAIIDLVGDVAELIKNVWETVLQPVINWIAQQIMPAIAPVLQWIGTRFLDVFGGIADVVKGLIKALEGVVEFISGVFTGNWEKAWGGVKKIFKGVWDSFVGIVKAPINLIIDLINGLLGGVEWMVNGVVNALNTISVDIPDWVPGIGGSTLGFDLPTWTAPQIPYLAKGGFVERNTPQLAMIGDNRHQGEVVAPEDKMQAMVDAAANSVRPGVTKEELEPLVNSAAMRIVSALSSVGFNLDGAQIATLQRMAQTGVDRRFNTVNVVI